jgi:hypothetical protein
MDSPIEGGRIMRKVWTLVVAVAIAGCTIESDEQVASTWRHQDGTPVSGAEIAQARTACVGASARELAPMELGFAGQPGLYPGGMGLEDGRASMDSNSPLWPSAGRQSIPLADCLADKGFVPSQ